MPMLTDDQCRKSLRDDRPTYIDGKRIDDVTLNSLLKVSIDWVTRTYDTHRSTDGKARNPMFALPATAAALRKSPAATAYSRRPPTVASRTAGVSG